MEVEEDPGPGQGSRRSMKWGGGRRSGDRARRNGAAKPGMVATECDTRIRLDLFYMSHGDGPDVFTSFPDPENCSIEELEQVLDYCFPDHKSFRRLNAIHSLVSGLCHFPVGKKRTCCCLPPLRMYPRKNSSRFIGLSAS